MVWYIIRQLNFKLCIRQDMQALSLWLDKDIPRGRCEVAREEVGGGMGRGLAGARYPSTE